MQHIHLDSIFAHKHLYKIVNKENAEKRKRKENETLLWPISSIPRESMKFF